MSGLRFVEVELERIQKATIYVECDDGDEAIDTAWEVVDEQDWDDTDQSADAAPCADTNGARYWTGGEQGHFEQETA